MNIAEKLFGKLDELIAAQKAAAMPLRERWLSADEVGALLDYSARHVSERLAVREDFPVPLRVDGGHPRWRADEVLDWADKVRARQQRARRTHEERVAA